MISEILLLEQSRCLIEMGRIGKIVNPNPDRDNSLSIFRSDCQAMTRSFASSMLISINIKIENSIFPSKGLKSDLRVFVTKGI